MNHTYGREEKLKSRATIESLFSSGKTVAKYPLRLSYVRLPPGEKTRVGVSVSKKYFKKAVDRNYYKRVLRELYRTNKGMLFDTTEGPYAIMFFYQTKERLPFAEIQVRALRLFEKFAQAEQAGV